MHQRIIVPLDGSKAGEAALPYVAQLVSKMAPDTTVEVTLLMVLGRLVNYVVVGETLTPVPYSEEQKQHAIVQTAKYLNEAGKGLREKGAAITAKVLLGDPSEEIIREAEESHADLIAMSTHGRSGIKRWVMGSITDKVLRHSGHVPVLTVKASPPGE